MDTKEQVLSFFESCEELKKCKFIMATTKIKDLLKTIVNCPELYRLFDAVTKDFDYLSVKEKCLVTTDDGIFSKSYVLLPQKVGHRLAFIFCLLVEFDRDSINLNDFLRKYYPEDGSYFGSYRAFCNQIIDGLRDCVTQVFKEQLTENNDNLNKVNSKKAELISALEIAIAGEIDFTVKNENLSFDDKESGLRILSALLGAVKSENQELVEALICGYNYFVLYNESQSEGINELLAMLVEYEQTLNGESE